MPSEADYHPRSEPLKSARKHLGGTKSLKNAKKKHVFFRFFKKSIYDIKNLFLYDVRKFGWVTFLVYNFLIYHYNRILEGGDLLFIKQFLVHFPFKFSWKNAQNIKKICFLRFFELIANIIIMSSMTFQETYEYLEMFLGPIELLWVFFPIQTDNIQRHFFLSS